MAFFGTCRSSAALGAALLLLCAVCRNPFFPPIGDPDPPVPLRKTPEGVIRQLVKAYETRDLAQYLDLFPKNGSFRFYIADQFKTAYLNRPYFVQGQYEFRDTSMQYIGTNALYYYWTQDVEIRSHKLLFSKCDGIKFTSPPIVNVGNFRYMVNDSGDTTKVEVLMEFGEIELTGVRLPTGIGEFLVQIDKQVFLLERDEARLWVIRKWYDFGTKD